MRKSQPPLIDVDDNDTEMNAAIDKARATAQQFIMALATPKVAQTSFTVKFLVLDGERSEHIWLLPVCCQEGKFRGTINNEPERVSTVKAGAEVTVGINEISDWMYVDNGRLVGGFTVRVLRARMSKTKGDEFDQSVPFVIDNEMKVNAPLVQFFNAIGNAEHELLESLLKTHPQFANRVGRVAVEGTFSYIEQEVRHPLNYATYCGNTKAVEILLENKADPNFRDKYKNTPLHEAAMRGRLEIIRLLAQYGADINARNRIGCTPLKAAAGNDEVKCAELLLELGADISLGLANNRGFGCDGESVLHNIRTVEIAKTLLQAGAAIDAQNKKKKTPLHHAIFNHYIDLAIYLIEQGARTDLRNKQRQTPIDLAKERWRQKDLRRLLKAHPVQQSSP